MDRGLHSNYSISLITLSQVGRPINALIQMDPRQFDCKCAALLATQQAECQKCHLDSEGETIHSTELSQHVL